MFSRPRRNPRLQPKWVQEQYAPPEAIKLAVETVGNTNWVLGYEGQLLATDIPPPPDLLVHFAYLQAIK